MIIHPDTQTMLGQIVESMPHALIITGARSVGLLSIAEHIATQLKSPKLIITPKRKLDGGKKLVTDYEKGSLIVDDIRDLYTLTRSKNTQNQVYIFDFGDRAMTQQAQNAFLKLLEEPRDNVYFILATHRVESLLPTIRSRAQLLRVRAITRSQSDQLRVIQKYKDDRAAALLLIDDVNLQLETVLRRSGDVAIAKQIERHMKTRQNINDNGNIRLQLAADML
ncbi:MAG: AAA family ATPase [Chloroflexi bacterium]|nr:MAG: AAA family ATPase [Chloroflexota bacterium]